MAHYIHKLIEQGEHQCQDFKFCINDSKKIAKSLVAFSNTDGGRLLIGVKDNGVVAGVRSEEEFYMIESAAHLYSKPQIDFETKTWKVDGKTVLEISIKPSKTKPHYALDENGKWLAYLRKDDENILANRVLIKVWKNKANTEGLFINYTETEEKLLDYLREKGTITISRFARMCKLPIRRAEHIIAKMISIEVVKPIYVEGKFQYALK